MSESDCGDLTCGHGEYAACELAHGSGGGSGEMQCVCKHHKKRGNLTPFHTQLTMISLALISFEAEHWLVRYIWKSTYIALFLRVYTLMLNGVRLAFTL